MIKIRQFIECDGHCGALVDIPKSTEIPDGWSNVSVTTGPRAHEPMHWCPRCTAIAGCAIWVPAIRLLVVERGLDLKLPEPMPGAKP